VDAIRIEPTNPWYDQIYAAWELNGSPSQFDMILYDESDPPMAVGGAIFRARLIGGTVFFWQSASEQATDIPEDNSRIKPHWSFASIRYRGSYLVPKREGMPGVRYQKLINDLILE